jgi:hypothetical protein
MATVDITLDRWQRFTLVRDVNRCSLEERKFSDNP